MRHTGVVADSVRRWIVTQGAGWNGEQGPVVEYSEDTLWRSKKNTRRGFINTRLSRGGMYRAQLHHTLQSSRCHFTFVIGEV